MHKSCEKIIFYLIIINAWESILLHKQSVNYKLNQSRPINVHIQKIMPNFNKNYEFHNVLVRI